MEAGLARLARQPGKRDEFLLCLYEKISSRLPGQFCCFDPVVKAQALICVSVLCFSVYLFYECLYIAF